MPNEVEIRITARDLTGPAFAAALAKMEAFKKAAASGFDTGPVANGLNTALMKMDRLKRDMSDLSFGKIDMSGLNSSLTAIKSKVQSLGIADIADINIPQGKIVSQLQFLKRMMQQAGIADIMDMNINQASLTKQLGRIGQISESIPVRFDVGKLPHISMSGFSVPISFGKLNSSDLPHFGDVSQINGFARAIEAAARS